MQQIIQRQLKKASMKSHSLLATSVEIEPVIRSIVNSLRKVYYEKSLRFIMHCDKDCSVRIDISDLYELLGNLLENACKWSSSMVIVKGFQRHQFVVIEIEDDGPGFPDNPNQLFKRGIRADQQSEGQGIGLFVSGEIISGAGGSITLGNIPTGGARVQIRLPS